MSFSLDFLAGTHIEAAARQLVAAAQEHGAASGTFNGIALAADASTSMEAIVAHFNNETTERSLKYRNSPEGQEADRQADKRRADAQYQHDALMNRLPSLDMKDDVAVLEWLCQMQAPSDHVGVILRRQTIISAFEKAGFVANANCGKEYRPGDRENMHRYLVGQALAGLKEGPAIHSILHKFADEWRKQFGSAA